MTDSIDTWVNDRPWCHPDHEKHQLARDVIQAAGETALRRHGNDHAAALKETLSRTDRALKGGSDEEIAVYSKMMRLAKGDRDAGERRREQIRAEELRALREDLEKAARPGDKSFTNMATEVAGRIPDAISPPELGRIPDAISPPERLPAAFRQMVKRAKTAPSRLTAQERYIAKRMFPGSPNPYARYEDGKRS